MKKPTIRFTALLIIVIAYQLNISSAFSQSPEKMSYQSVIRNASGVLVKSLPVGIRISILQTTSTGTAVFVETHIKTTNANGLASLEIGMGTPVTGTFAAIDWAAGPYFIKTETDPLGGTTYTITGTSQLMSVPYAMYAKTAGNSPWTVSGNNIYNSNSGYVGIGTSTPAYKLDVAGGIRSTSATGAASFLASGTGSASNYAFLQLQNGQSGANDRSWNLVQKASSTINRFAFEYYNGSTWSEPLTIFPTGVVSMSSQSRAKASPSADQTIPNNTWTTLTMNSEIFDSQNEFNTTTSTFTATTTGYYQIHANVTWKGTTAAGTFETAIGENGSAAAINIKYRTDAQYFTEEVSDVFYLESNETIQVLVRQITGASQVIIGSGSRTFFTIHKLS